MRSVPRGDPVKSFRLAGLSLPAVAVLAAAAPLFAAPGRQLQSPASKVQPQSSLALHFGRLLRTLRPEYRPAALDFLVSGDRDRLLGAIQSVMRSDEEERALLASSYAGREAEFESQVERRVQVLDRKIAKSQDVGEESYLAQYQIIFSNEALAAGLVDDLQEYGSALRKLEDAKILKNAKNTAKRLAAETPPGEEEAAAGTRADAAGRGEPAKSQWSLQPPAGASVPRQLKRNIDHYVEYLQSEKRPDYRRAALNRLRLEFTGGVSDGNGSIAVDDGFAYNGGFAGGDQAVAIGQNARAIGKNAIAIGPNAKAIGENALDIRLENGDAGDEAKIQYAQILVNATGSAIVKQLFNDHPQVRRLQGRPTVQEEIAAEIKRKQATWQAKWSLTGYITSVAAAIIGLIISSFSRPDSWGIAAGLLIILASLVSVSYFGAYARYHPKLRKR